VRWMTRTAAAAGMVSVWAGCAAVLGLDAGVDDGSDSGADIDAPGVDVAEAYAVSGDSGRAVDDAAPGVDAYDASEGTTGLDAAGASEVATDAAQTSDRQPDDACSCPPVPNGTANCTPTGGCAHVCDQGYVDCAGSPCSCGGGLRCLSNDTCGACRSALQACQLGTDCCSGDCGPTSTCL
jgi:hypothetical protein